MKREGHIWERFIDRETIKAAIINAARGKKRKKAVRRVLADVDGSADLLAEMLRSGAYKPAEYKVETLLTDSGKVREIFKQPFFPDRVVQHGVAMMMRDRWTRALTGDTYACLPGRGINCRSRKGDVVRRMKRMVAAYRGRPLFCLKMDIRKFYPSVGNEMLARLQRKYCKDEKMLELLDSLNFNSEGMPIGDYLSQLWANIITNPIIRFCKSELGARDIAVYMDDFVICHDDKREMNSWMWRIMNFTWYTLGLEFGHRQIFPVGDDRHGRAIDFVGYRFYRTHTWVRKRTKKALIRRRHKAGSLPSYLGILKKCDSRNLTRKVIEENNGHMRLDDIGIKIERPFEGDKIPVEALVDKEIEILDFDFQPSRREPGTSYVKIQIRFEGRKRFFCGGFKYLIQVLQQVDRSQLPLETVIRNKRGYYFDGTINE